MRTLAAVALVCIAGCIGLNRLEGQVATATILGTVTDSSGAAIPDASIQVKNVGTGITQSASSNAQGRYLVPDLGIGDYQLQASKTGFTTIVRKGVNLTIGAQSVVDFSLQVGQQAQTVTVEAAASQVETTNAAVSSLISPQQMAELPLNGRNFENLIFLSPGVEEINSMAPNARQGRANVISAAGARPEGYEIIMDDESIDNFFRRGMGTITGSSLGMEAMAEFQTLTNTYGAQFGGNGAVINSVSKSGTNSFHGSAYLFERNSAMDARGFFDPTLIPFRRTQPGGSIGGPIKKDKAFFFFNYEGIWELQDQSHIAFVPDDNHRTPTFAEATNPTAYSAILGVMALYPQPTFGFNPAAGTGEANVFGNFIAHENYMLGRFDYTLSNKDTVFLRYFYDRQYVIDPYSGGNGSASAGYLPLWPEKDQGRNHFATTEWRRIISPTMVNTARISFSRPNTGDYIVNQFPALQIFPGDVRADSEISMTGITALGQSYAVPAVDIQNRFTGADDLIWTKGGQTIRTGVQLIRVDSNIFYQTHGNGVFTYTSGAVTGLNEFLAGDPATSFSGTPVNQAQCVAAISVPCYDDRDYRELDIFPYIQDDWKVSSRLTLNLGLRYEPTTNAYALHNALYAATNFQTNTGFVNVPNVDAKNPNLKNWDPRFGFAYDMFADHKTSLRGGFAVTHSPVFTAEYNPDYSSSNPWPALTSTNSVFPNANFTSFTNSVSTGWDWHNSVAPYLIQYNLNVQREIGAGTVLTVAYVGSHGVDLFTAQEKNPPAATINANGQYQFGNLVSGKIVANPRLNPHFTYLLLAEPGTSSRYNSAQISLNRRLTHSVQGQISYTFSKCIDDGGSPIGSLSGGDSSNLLENPYLRDPIDKGLCYYNVTSTVRVNALWTLPFHGDQFVEGWQLSGIVTQNTGMPFSIYDGADDVGYQSSGSPRPNYNLGCNVQVGMVTEWFNPGCYSLQTPGTLGDAGRDTVTGPGLAQLDLSLTKDTKITKFSEDFHVQFRAEAYNLFNHPQFGLPGNSVFSSIAGTPNASAGIISALAPNSSARQIQLGLKILF
jgi:hypothetical protein